MQRQLQDDERQAFEAYLLAGDDQSLIQKALAHLVPGSVPHNYLYFVNLLTRAGGIKSEADQQTFNNFTNLGKHKNTNEARQIKLWHLLRSFDNEPSNRAKILDELVKDYLQFSFEHQKPELRAGIKADESSQDEDESCHTLKPDFFNFSNAEIIQKKTRKMKTRLEQIDKIVNEDERKRERKREIAQVLQKLSHKGDGIWHELDFNQFDAESVYQAALQNYCQLAQIQNESLFQQIAKGLASFREQEPNYALPPHFVQALTIQQLDKLAKLDSWFKSEDNFIGAYFQKQFCEELSMENQEIWSIQEKLQNLERLYRLAKSQGLPKAFQKQFLEEILALGPKTGTFSKQFFRDYIDMLEKHELFILNGHDNAVAEHNKRIQTGQKAATNWNQYCQNVRSNSQSNIGTLIVEYLDYFCEQAGGSLSDYYKDFRETTYKEIEKKWKVWLARDGLNSLDQDSITLDFYKKMADEVQLQFSKQNKEIFTVDEAVSLEVIIKNIKVLHVKVFEFNTETYYKKNLMPFNTGVNLDGLDASENNQYQYDVPGNIRHRETFNFPQLKNRVGLFIVEFMGNGYSARAVIKKGSLSIVHRSTVAGHLAYVLDENKKVCISDRTGVWFDSKYYPADKATGRIFIPYSKQELSQKIIMINGDFAQLGEFTRKTEEYQFNAQFYLHSGSVLVGANTNIVVKAQLNINGRRAQLNLLKNVKIVLTTYNYIDNLPVTKTFPNLAFSNDKELSITFQVPPNLRNIDVQLSCEILNATTKKNEKFNAQNQFQIISNDNISDQVMSMPYLKKVNGQYEISFLGRNGEPACKKKIILLFKHRLQQKKSLNTTLITDKNGTIKLGSLPDVTQLVAFAEQEGQQKGNWTLQHSNGTGSSYWSYPQTDIEVLEGDNIELPISLLSGQTKLQRQWLSLIHSINGLLIDDWFDQVQLKHSGDENTGYHYIQIEGLQQGEYDLRFISGHEAKQFKIKVHKGQQWSQDGFILKKSCLQENVQSANLLKISKVQILQDEESPNKTVEVTVKNTSGSVHLHAFAHQFLPVNQLELVQLIQDLQQQHFSYSSFPFSQWQNIYQSNRAMADEIRYVFDRKQLESQFGNTLDRPTLLNKRNFVQTTTSDAEQLNNGAQYSSGFGDDMLQSQMIQQNCLSNVAYGSRSRGLKMCKKAEPYGRGGVQMIGEGTNIHSEFQSFIKTAPLQKLNQTPVTTEGDQATFSFNCDLNQFSQLVLIAVDKDSITQRSVDLDAQPVQKRDLRLLQVLNQDQGLTESRSTIKILRSGENFIEDISSTDVQLVDDLAKVYEILTEIRKVQGVSGQGFEAFDFILKWHRLSTSEKDRYYSDYCCHELNFFISKKDETYFRQTVKPFLQSKMEKQFMDFYLLGQKAEVIKYAELHLIQTLNSLEECLLIQVLQQNGQGQQAQGLAQRMQLEQNAKSQKDQDSVNYDDKIFDLVLNLNTLSQNEGVLSNLKKQVEVEKQQEMKSCLFGAPMAPSPMARMQMCAMAMPTQSQIQPELSMMSRGPPRMMEMKKKAMPKSSLRRASKESALMDCSVDLFDDDYAQNQLATVVKKQNFEEVEATSEYMETHYFRQTDIWNSRNLVKLNQFWCDYASHLAQPTDLYFLSRSFTDCSKSDRESFFAICVLDLPMETREAHDFKPNEQRGVLIKAASNLLLFKKEIKACEVDLSRNDIMVIHRYSEVSQSTVQNGESQSGKPDEFLARTAYACEVVITNVAPKPKSFNLLYQVPEGAVPLKLTKYMKSQFVALQPYRSLKVVFHFYFPISGQFKHYPSNISVNGIVTARGGANEMTVVDSKKISKIQSFEDILHAGSKQDVLNFLRRENLFSFKMNFSFYSMLYLLKDKQFFEEAIAILKDRCIFEPSVWQYAFFHKHDEVLMRECLMMHPPPHLVYYLGSHFKSGLIDVDENTTGNTGLTKHLEYHPMVNSRTHLLGQNHKIMNATFRKTYDSFLASTVQKDELSLEDKMIFVYYLQLQDRMQEAIDLFNKIEAPSENDGTLKIQYDYLQAYFDFFSGTDDGYKIARRIVQKYDNYPVSTWRMMFLTIADQLNEFDGEFDNEEEMISVDAGATAIDAQIRDKRAQNKKEAKKREPQLNVEVDAKGTLKVESVNVSLLSVKYYIINAELLFSRQPFLKDNTEGFSYVKAYHTLEHVLHGADATEDQLNQYVKADIVIPDKLVNQNMVIEITSGDLQKFLTYYSNELKVNVLEQYGELKVTHATTGAALPRTYVKVFYQKKSGGEMFYRDGYTDIRGKIEYAQTSGDKLKDVKRFAILVQNDKYGSKILECDPPKDVTGNQQQVNAGGPVVSMAAQKMNRLQHRQEYAIKNRKC